MGFSVFTSMTLIGLALIMFKNVACTLACKVGACCWSYLVISLTTARNSIHPHEVGCWVQRSEI